MKLEKIGKKQVPRTHTHVFGHAPTWKSEEVTQLYVMYVCTLCSLQASVITSNHGLPPPPFQWFYLFFPAFVCPLQEKERVGVGLLNWARRPIETRWIQTEQTPPSTYDVQSPPPLISGKSPYGISTYMLCTQPVTIMRLCNLFRAVAQQQHKPKYSKFQNIDGQDQVLIIISTLCLTAAVFSWQPPFPVIQKV